MTASANCAFIFRVSTIQNFPVRQTCWQSSTAALKTVEIDLRELQSVEQLHAQLRAKLNFPAFCGENWDAFWDAIAGLVELPERVRLLGWASFEASFPRDAAIMRKCLSDYRQELGERASEIEYD